MSDASVPLTTSTLPAKKKPSETLRIARYIGLRILMLFFTVVIGTYLAVLIANWGGAMDTIRESQIREQVGMYLRGDRKLLEVSPEEFRRRYDLEVARRKKLEGLDQPFFQRSLRYLRDALTLDLGPATYLISDSGSRQVRNIIIERLPATLLLFGTSEMIIFFLALWAALPLSRRYGSLLDRTIVALAPTSTAPAWFYGIFLLLIFAGVLHVLPFGNMVDVPPPDTNFAYALSVMKHLVLPFAAILLSSICLAIYSWRTFFLIFSSEDYVEMAKAKGLPDGMVQRRYILRPTLPPIITGFSFSVISLWQGGIVLETVFNWPGLGRLLSSAISSKDTPVIVGEVVIYGYLLATTVFLLDIVYALIDPRIKLGGAETPV
jgi:peptide/nickel transport system permease protein